MTEPVSYRKTIVDSIHLDGWTPETVQSAVAALSELCAARTGAADDDSTQLANEMLRWLGCAVRKDPKSLISYLHDVQPSGEHESHWETLERWLAQDEPIETSIQRLQKSYPDPVPVLEILLEVRAKPPTAYDDIDPQYQRAVEILVALGTRESLGYLLDRLGLFCWNDSDRLRALLGAHAATFAELTREAWPRLGWFDRGHLLEIHRLCDIDAGALLTLLFAVDTNTMGYEPLGDYVETLSHTEDPRAEARIRQLMIRAIDDLQRGQTEEADSFVRKAGHVLVNEMERPLGPELRQRAAELGIRWRGIPRRGHGT